MPTQIPPLTEVQVSWIMTGYFHFLWLTLKLGSMSANLALAIWMSGSSAQAWPPTRHEQPRECHLNALPHRRDWFRGCDKSLFSPLRPWLLLKLKFTVRYVLSKSLSKIAAQRHSESSQETFYSADICKSLCFPFRKLKNLPASHIKTSSLCQPTYTKIFIIGSVTDKSLAN